MSVSARAHKNRNFQLNNSCISSRLVSERNLAISKGLHDLADAFQTSCPNPLIRRHWESSLCVLFLLRKAQTLSPDSMEIRNTLRAMEQK